MAVLNPVKVVITNFPEGQVEISRINYGIEGGVCCEKGEPGAGGAAASR